MLLAVAASALLQALFLGVIPWIIYWIWQRHRSKLSFGEALRKAGLQVGRPQYLIYSLVLSILGAVALVVDAPSMEPLTRKGSALAEFAGLGLGGQAIAMALLYGIVQTGFTEELLFRGLIAGSLSRRLSFWWANLVQSLIFLLPHLGVLFVAPEMWRLLFLVYAVALVLGWIRIQSGSILGSWLIHGSSNVTMALLVASRTRYPLH